MTTYTTENDETFTITTRIGQYGDEEGLYTIIEAADVNGEVASELYADITTGQIMQVYTRPENRREGLATALADYAAETGIELYHSPEEHRTEEGQAWAEATDMIDEIDEDLAYQPAI